MPVGEMIHAQLKIPKVKVSYVGTGISIYVLSYSRVCTRENIKLRLGHLYPL